MASRIGESREGDASMLSDLPRLLNRFIEQVLQLLETQFALFKAEIRDTGRAYVKSGVRIAIGVAGALVGFALLSVGIALGLAGLFGSTALSFAVVGIFYLLVAGGVAYAAARKLSVRPALTDTKRELERDKQWIKSET